MVTLDIESPIFKALGDPTRRAILALLGSEELAVLEIAERFPVSRPAVSKHLRVLREAGLVDEHRRGRRRIYRAVPGGLEPAAAWLEEMGVGSAVPSRPATAAGASPKRRGRTEAKIVRGKPASPRPPVRRPRPEADWRTW